jgi:hypothetical protein
VKLRERGRADNKKRTDIAFASRLQKLLKINSRMVAGSLKVFLEGSGVLNR